MEVRKASVKDCERILALWKQFMNYCSHLDEFSTLNSESEKIFYNHLVDSVRGPNTAVFLAIDSKKIVGYIKAAVSSRSPVYEITHVGEISDIFILPGYRRLGAAKLLVNRAEKWFGRKGLDLFWVKVHCANRLGNAFWRALGYEDYMIERMKWRIVDE